MAARYDLGVLFVHGIGQQHRGETLTRFGEPLNEWIDRWAGGAATEVSQAEVRHPLRNAPPHASVVWRFPGQRERRILFAESWWAESFEAPGFAEVLNWLSGAALVTLSLHFGARLRRAIRALRGENPSPLTDPDHHPMYGKAAAFWQEIRLLARGARASPLRFGILLREMVYFIFGWPLLATVLLAGFVLIAITSAVPGLGGFARRIQASLAGTIGDSYVLLTRPIRSAAILSQVRRDLAWLAARSQKVAIVAHSQGAAVTHRALRSGLPVTLDPKKCCLFTFGSGFKKLAELERLRQRNLEFSERRGFLTFVGVLMMAAGVWQLGYLPLPLAGLIPGLGGVVLFFGALLWLGDLILCTTGVAFDSAKLRPPVRWEDFYASADPVPNGALFDDPPDYLKERSHEIHNRGSNLTDHNTYWENGEQFTGPLAAKLAALLGVKIHQPGDSSRLQADGDRRARRVGALRASRSLIVLASLALLAQLSLSGRLTVFGADAIGFLSRRLDTWRIEWLQDRFKALTEFADPLVFGAALVVAAAALGYQIVYRLWTWWQAKESDRCFRPVDEPGCAPPVLFLCATLVLLIAMGALAAGAVPLAGESWSREPQKLGVFTAIFAIFAGVAALVSGISQAGAGTAWRRGYSAAWISAALSPAFTLLIFESRLVDFTVEPVSLWFVPAAIAGVALPVWGGCRIARKLVWSS